MCTQPLGPTCAKQPCKPCTICGNVTALGGSACDTLSLPTTVVKEEFVAPGRRFTLGAITYNASSSAAGERRQLTNYVGGVVQR